MARRHRPCVSMSAEAYLLAEKVARALDTNRTAYIENRTREDARKLGISVTQSEVESFILMKEERKDDRRKRIENERSTAFG